ncbi:GH3 auxin-responsive promoter family protein, partial [Pricia sp.]|uniref:GH3 family domain-containing protein n=1 Tax=Pricia sp. TaxID=2268138 RepID=UPI003593BD43
MPIIGNIIKGFIEVRDKLAEDKNHVEEQREVLKRLLKTAKDTAFGKHYKFAEILASEQFVTTFADTIPYHDYNKIDAAWWQKLHDGEEDVTWPGVPDYFALSSGTTGTTSKRIPVTDEMISSIRNAGIQQVYALSNFDLPSDFFEKGILMLGSSTDLEEVDSHKEGEISGISASNIPTWFRGYYKPGQDISAMEDWDEKVQKIAEEAPNWDIG